MERKILCYCDARTRTKIGMTAGKSFKKKENELLNKLSQYLHNQN